MYALMPMYYFWSVFLFIPVTLQNYLEMDRFHVTSHQSLRWVRLPKYFTSIVFVLQVCAVMLFEVLLSRESFFEIITDVVFR